MFEPDSPDSSNGHDLPGAGVIHIVDTGTLCETSVHNLDDHWELHLIGASRHVNIAVVSASANSVWRLQMSVEFQVDGKSSFVLDLLHKAGTQGERPRLKRR